MNMETPKNYDKKGQYTSPIGLLKNYSSINAQNSSNTYEEEFYKIKAQRLEAQLEQLREQNSILKAKVTDCNATNQILRQKIFVLENTFDRAERSFTQRTVPSFISDSNYPSAQNSDRQSPSKNSNYFSVSIPEKSQRSYNAQIQRLVKQNRVLKNEHELQMTKLRDQNKRLNRKILEVESNVPKKSNESQPEVQERIYRQKQEERLLKIQKMNNQLRKDNEEFEKQKKKLQDKLKLLEDNNKALRRENQQFKAIHSSNFRRQDAIGELQKKLSEQEQSYKQTIKALKFQLQQKNPIQTSSSESTSLKKQNQSEGVLLKEMEILKRKINMQEQDLADKQQEIRNILTKLKPLLEKEKNKSNKDEIVGGDSKRASLSILEVFLKKYKIHSF